MHGKNAMFALSRIVGLGTSVLITYRDMEACVKPFITYVRKYSGNVNWFKMLSRGRSTRAN